MPFRQMSRISLICVIDSNVFDLWGRDIFFQLLLWSREGGIYVFFLLNKERNSKVKLFAYFENNKIFFIGFLYLMIGEFETWIEMYK